MAGGSEPRAVAPGEELDLDTLVPYLDEQIEGFNGDDLEVRQFPGGHSNLTYLLVSNSQEYVLRRPPMGLEIATAHDMGREYRILSALQGAYPAIPRTYVFCEDKAILGAPFYVMERVQGIILRSNVAPAGIDLNPDVMRALSTSMIDNLAAIHAVDYQSTDLADFGKPDGYIERQVTGWTRRYADARTDDIPQVEKAAEWLAANLPPGPSRAALIHNDYKYDNVVLDESDLSRIKAVLDWEMATIADPWMDLGTALSMWVDADDPDFVQILPFGPTALPGNLNRQQLVNRYEQVSGQTVDNILFYFVYGLFKMAVVLQQIYKRYTLGHSSDPRFANMIVGVNILSQLAERAIDRGRISELG